MKKLQILTIATLSMLINISNLQARSKDNIEVPLQIDNQTTYPIKIDIKSLYFNIPTACPAESCWKTRHNQKTIEIKANTTTRGKYSGLMQNVTITNKNDTTKTASKDTGNSSKEAKDHKVKIYRSLTITDNAGTPVISLK